MLNSKNVVTLGCDFRQPKGGVAQVLNTYSKFMSPFHFICTTKGRGVIINFLQLLYSVSEFIFLCLFNKS